jgi:hypothetical protein
VGPSRERTGKLAVVPKCFHEPTVEIGQEVRLSASLERELEEVLLGRQDLEGLTIGSQRQADPFHEDRLSEPMRWLLDRRDTDAYRVNAPGSASTWSRATMSSRASS